MTLLARRFTTTLVSALTLAALGSSIGCDNDSKVGVNANSGAGMTGATPGKQTLGPTGGEPALGNLGAGGAPPFGEPTGTGYATGDAAHGTGMGSGMLGYHGTGAAGTSAAVSDMHPAGEPPKGGGPQWVLPEQ